LQLPSLTVSVSGSLAVTLLLQGLKFKSCNRMC